MDWLTAYKLPIGAWANTIFLWMKVNLAWAFNALAKALEWLIEGFLWLLQTPNPLVIIAVFMAIAWAMQRNWKTVIGVGLGRGDGSGAAAFPPRIPKPSGQTV